MQRPEISVIIPVLDAFEKLRHSLDPLRYKLAAAVEFIILNGRPCDRTAEYVKEWQSGSGKMVTYVSEEDDGVYHAMNKGISLSRGRYLYFLGAGDLLLPDALNSAISQLPSNELTLLYGDVRIRGERYSGLLTNKELCCGNICHQGVLYGRQIFEVLGFYSLRYPAYADWEFNMRCFGCKEIKKRYLDEELAIYEGGGLSTQGDRQFWSDRGKLIFRHLGWSLMCHCLFTRQIHLRSLLPDSLKRLWRRLSRRSQITAVKEHRGPILRRKI